MRRLIAPLALLATAATLLFAQFGCSHRLTGVLLKNNPPHTFIFIQGPVDTVNHVVHLYWYGGDQDGYVSKYEIKLVNPADTTAGGFDWRTTHRTDTLLTIQTPAGFAEPTFYARAIDNLGLADPQPAVQQFNFRNTAPVVTWKVVPNRFDRSDTTYASASVSWTVSDRDGEPALIRYRLWLDGAESRPFFVLGLQSCTVPSDSFRVNGVFPASGPRTLFLQPIDDGGMAGGIISTTWYVRAPAGPLYTPEPGRRPGRLLIIDDLPNSAPSGFMDSLYTNTAFRNLPADSWSVLNVEAFQPFRTSADLAQTMGLFDAVVWYRGGLDSAATLMRSFQPGMESYLNTGGNLYLDGLFLVSGVNATGALSQSFAEDYLDCEPGGPLRNYFRTSTNDSTAGWGNINGSTFVSDMFAETIRQQQLAGFAGAGGLRVFNVRRTSDIALLAVPGALTPANSDSLPVGVWVPQASGGAAAVFTLPITLRGSGNGPRLLAKVYQRFGLIRP